MKVRVKRIRPDYVKLRIEPCSLEKANVFIGSKHRHHDPTQGLRFALKLVDEDGKTRGVATAGRSVARMVKSGVLEVTRVCTDGTPNACSMLYGACARVGREMGYNKIQTYILDSEPGTSLKAAGWTCEGLTAGGMWAPLKIKIKGARERESSSFPPRHTNPGRTKTLDAREGGQRC